MRVKKVIHRRIPKRENALGLAYNDKIKDPPKKVGTIEVDKRQTPIKYSRYRNPRIYTHDLP